MSSGASDEQLNRFVGREVTGEILFGLVRCITIYTQIPMLGLGSSIFGKEVRKVHVISRCISELRAAERLNSRGGGQLPSEFSKFSNNCSLSVIYLCRFFKLFMSLTPNYLYCIL